MLYVPSFLVEEANMANPRQAKQALKKRIQQFIDDDKASCLDLSYLGLAEIPPLENFFPLIECQQVYKYWTYRITRSNIYQAGLRAFPNLGQ
jgi:hypothetical protein